MQRVTVTLDDDLMADIDLVIAERGYQNRSEAIRDLARAGLRQAMVETGSMTDCVGVLSYTYDHQARDLAKRLTNTFHDHHGMSVASMHVHLDHDRCLEVSILRGKMSDVRHFADHITAERHVTHGELAIIPSKE
jgi:CopG family transcriptional regulator, nickel-responsive regulator